jgi:hypothetical protein
MLKRAIGLVVAACVMAVVSAASASAADTQNYSFPGQGSGDSSTCGPDWANDTYTRVFKVVPTEANNGTWRVTEYFTHGHFVTFQGPSPQSCADSNSNRVSANLHGSFHGFEVIQVSGGTYDQAAAGSCSAAGSPPTCTTADFINSAFPGNSGYTSSDYWFTYKTGNSLACANHWIDAATGDSGDIATLCS